MKQEIEELQAVLNKRLENYNNQGAKSKNAENILFAKIGELQYCIKLLNRHSQAMEQPKWFDVNARKPKLNKEVLVTFISTLTDQRVYKVDRMNKKDNCMFTSNNVIDFWQELPPRPNQTK